MKVLYIAGVQRSGTTLLTRMLGELPGVFPAGELRLIWQRSLLNNEPCGCGNAFSDCDLWREIFATAFGGIENVNPALLRAQLRRLEYTPLLLAPGGMRLLARRSQAEVQTLTQLYRAIAETTSARVIVDASKLPRYGQMLRMIPGIDLYVVHMVRDPRGVEYSCLRRKHQGHPEYQHHSTVHHTWSWVRENMLQEYLAFGHRSTYLPIRYEDLIQNPSSVVTTITRLIGEPDLGPLAIDGNRVQFGANHMVAGREDHARAGAFSLTVDNEWRVEMDDDARATVTRLTFPLLRRYGYD